MAEDDNLFRFEHLEVWQRAADMALICWGAMPTALRGHGKLAASMAIPSSGHGTLRLFWSAEINYQIRHMITGLSRSLRD